MFPHTRPSNSLALVLPHPALWPLLLFTRTQLLAPALFPLACTTSPSSPPAATAPASLPKSCLWPLCFVPPSIPSSVAHYKQEIFLNTPKTHSSPRTPVQHKALVLSGCSVWPPPCPLPLNRGLIHMARRQAGQFPMGLGGVEGWGCRAGAKAAERGRTQEQFRLLRVWLLLGPGNKLRLGVPGILSLGKDGLRHQAGQAALGHGTAPWKVLSFWRTQIQSLAGLVEAVVLGQRSAMVVPGRHSGPEQSLSLPHPYSH